MVVCWRIQNEWMVWMFELSQNFAYLPFGSVLVVHVWTAWWRLSGCEFERLRSSPCCTTSWTLSVTEDGFDFLRFLGLGISHIRSDKGDGDFTTVGLGRRRCSDDLIADLSASSLCRRFNCLLGVLPSWLPCLDSFGMSLEVLNMIFYVLFLKDLNVLSSVNIQLTPSACLCGCRYEAAVSSSVVCMWHRRHHVQYVVWKFVSTLIATHVCVYIPVSWRFLR